MKTLRLVSFCLVSVLLNGANAHAEDPVVRVEIDWELLIDQPDLNNASPSISFAIAAGNNLDGLHGLFTVNYSESNGFQAGGFENQIWNGRSRLKTRKTTNTEVLSTPGEVIRFTHVMLYDSANSRIYFDVQNFSSTTWGVWSANFVTQYKDVAGYAGLDQFSPIVSMNNSGVIEGKNRVSYILLRRVRQTTASGATVSTEINKYIHQALTWTIQTNNVVDAVGQVVPRSTGGN